MLDIQLTPTSNGTKIQVVKDGEVTSEGTIYNGITPEFKVEDDELKVRYPESGR